MFITVNDRILDEKKLGRQQLLLEKAILAELEEILGKYGFKKRGGCFSNKDILLECSIRFTKQQYL